VAADEAMMNKVHTKITLCLFTPQYQWWIGPPARLSFSPPGSGAPSGSTWVSCAQDRYSMLMVPEGRISGKITEKEHIEKILNFKYV
jgi:hypothetical protein